MKTEKLVFAFIVLAFLFSCNDDDDDPNDSSSDYRISEVIGYDNALEEHKITYTYTNEKLTEMTEFYMDENSWITIRKHEVSYNGNTVTVLEYYDKESNGNWDLRSKREFVFNNNLMTQEKYYYQSQGNLTPRYRYDYLYNGATFTGFEEYDYDMNGMAELEYKGECIYSNDQVTLLEFKEFELDGTEWILSDKDVFTYDENNKIKEIINYDQDRSGEFYADDRDVYTYSGNLVSAIDDYDWNDDSDIWVLDNTNSFMYNNFDNLIEVNSNYGYKVTLNYEEGKGNTELLMNTPLSLIRQVPFNGSEPR